MKTMLKRFWFAATFKESHFFQVPNNHKKNQFEDFAFQLKADTFLWKNSEDKKSSATKSLS